MNPETQLLPNLQLMIRSIRGYVVVHDALDENSAGQRRPSSIVEMALTVEGTSHRVAQMGGDFIILATPIEIGPIKADLTLEIDGEAETWRVFLPKGVTKKRARTPIEHA